MKEGIFTFYYPPNCRFGGRLVSIEENNKFRRTENEGQIEAPNSLKDFVSEIRTNFDLK